MHRIYDLVYFPDIMKLNKESLESIALELDLPTDCSAIELAQSIEDTMNNGREIRYRGLAPVELIVLAGKVSVSWYPIVKTNHDENLIDVIAEQLHFNPLSENRIPPIEQLTSRPTIIGGFLKHPETPNQYYLRVMVKTGIKRTISGIRALPQITTTLCTVFINENDGYLEIRADSKLAAKVEKMFAQLLDGHIESLDRRNVVAPFGYEIEQLATALNGRFIEAEAIPEGVLESLTAEQVQAVVDILTTVDTYLRGGDIVELEQVLLAAKTTLSESETSFANIPFSATVLAGMEKLGMGTGDDGELSLQPLYTLLKPYLQNQGGYIQFPLDENGLTRYYKIKVGLVTNSVYFVTPATENAITHVRNIVLRLT